MATGFEIIRTSSLILTGDASYFEGNLEMHRLFETPEEFMTQIKQEREMSKTLEALLIAGGVYIQITRGLVHKDTNHQERETVIMRIIINIDNYLRATNRFYDKAWPPQPWIYLLSKFYRYSEALNYSFDRHGNLTEIKNLDVIHHYLYHAMGEKDLESFSMLSQGHYETHELLKTYGDIRSAFEYQRDNVNINK